MAKSNSLNRSGYSQEIRPTIDGARMSMARAVNVDVHHKHCYQIAKHIKGMYAQDAVDFLIRVMEKKEAVPYTRRSRKGKGGNTMAGHRRGAMAAGRYPYKASRVFIKLIESAMDNARQQHEDVEAADMLITHTAAHRGQVKRGFRPRARGRATPHNHYQVNLEIFLEDIDGEFEEDEF